MPKSTKHKSDAFETIHRSASALRKVGAINKATMRRFDESCLATKTKTGVRVQIRKRAT